MLTVIFGGPLSVDHNWWSISGVGLGGNFSEDHNCWSNSGMPCGGASPMDHRWWTIPGFLFQWNITGGPFLV